MVQIAKSHRYPCAMTRRPKVSATALFAVLAVLGALSSHATAEQASQPAATAAGEIDAGKYHSCAVLPAGALRCWGYGADGALGYGSTASIGDDEVPAAAGPVNLGAGRTVRAVAAGAVHTCALDDRGSVRCWGYAGDGRLGYGNLDNIGDDESPASAGTVDLGAGRTATAITAGRGHTCALLDDAGVRCWGYGLDGRLGSGTGDSIGDDETPGSMPVVALPAGHTAVRAISAGDSTTCAILEDGSVSCWGYGQNGQLGYGNTVTIGNDESLSSIAPVQLGTGRTAVAIASGDFHTCVLLDNATVKCWGYGGSGRLG
jgi:alpha-tubulin suppressor-like RCC1 family protein